MQQIAYFANTKTRQIKYLNCCELWRENTVKRKKRKKKTGVPFFSFQVLFYSGVVP